MDISLDKNTRAVAHAAAKPNSGRPVLEAVHLAGKRIEAANGFIFARRLVQDIKNGVDILLPASQILEARDISSTLKQVLLQISNGKTETGTLTVKDAVKNSIKKQPGTFPNLDHLMPAKDRPVTQEITIAVDILKQLIKIAGSANKIKFRFYGATEAVGYRCIDFAPEENDTYGLLMPMVE